MRGGPLWGDVIFGLVMISGFLHRPAVQLSHQRRLEGQITAEIISRCLRAGAVKEARCGGSTPMIRYHFALTPSHLLLPSPSLLRSHVGMSATRRKCLAVIVFCERHSHVRHLALRLCWGRSPR